MIAFLTGQVIQRGANWVVVQAGEVGYQVFIPAHIEIGADGRCELYCSHQVREDSQTLYGFSSFTDKTLFELLLSVSGVGPKSALAIMGIGSNDRIQTAIAQGETALFEAVPGIGKKAAAKIIVELKSKIGGVGSLLPEESSADADLVSALEGLGYRRSEILKILRDLPSGVTSTEDRLRWALKELAVQSK